MSNIDSYIKYFQDDSEESVHRQTKLKQYYAINSGKSARSQQKEMDALQNENRSLKQHMDKMKSTINDLAIQNKTLDSELINSKLKYDEYKHSIQGLED